MQWLKRFLIGRPLKSALLKHEKYNVFWGLSILSCDAISSIAYAVEEILLILAPALGLLAYDYMLMISGAIIVLLAILATSYRQTIEQYPSGGGAYAVASDHLGVYAGVLAGVALLIDYTLTVAVSISSGVSNVISAFPELLPYRISFCLLVLLILYIGNLRGVRESSRLFGLQAYVFMLAIIAMVIAGLVKIFWFGYQPAPIAPLCVQPLCQSVSLFLLLKAFSSGCAALTGVETVSNAVPNFEEPAVANARKTLAWLAIIVFLLFGGLSVLARLYPVVPSETVTVLAQINAQIFGKNIMYYFIQFATMIILMMAANSAYAGFPMLLSVMGRDGFAPRQFSKRGERLTYSNGITILTVLAAVLVVLFRASVTGLIGLYAVGVFTSFTLSQSGMFMHWLRSRGAHWLRKAAVNGLGALVTLVAVVIITITKFTQGAWIVIVVTPILMMILLKIKRHYTAVAEQVDLKPADFKGISKLVTQPVVNHVIIPLSGVNEATISALRYAKSITNNIVAFHVVMEGENTKTIKEQWRQLKTDVPLILKYSPYRKVIEPFIEFITTYRQESCGPDDTITVILNQFCVTRPWHLFLHNQTTLWFAKELLKERNVVIATIPLQLQRDI
jgi:amino acid transporter